MAAIITCLWYAWSITEFMLVSSRISLIYGRCFMHGDQVWICSRLPLFGMCLLLIVIVALGLWFIRIQREKAAVNLTPELVVETFEDAGFEVNNLHKMTDYPGPMSPGKRGLRFSGILDGENIDILIVLYTDRGEARQVASAVNELNQRMHGGYGCAFYRGYIVLQAYPCSKEIANKCNKVLQSAK
jgi:hypothetical protein